jgi:hypothetical protein
MLKNKKTAFALSIIPQVLIVKLLSNYPKFIETYYSNGLYQFTSKIFRFVFGWLPFSVGDVFYTIAGIYIMRWIYINRKRIISDTKSWLTDIFIVVSLVYFMFHLFWGMNYYRLPLHKTLNLENTYTTEELIEVTEKLIEISNSVHIKITQNDTNKVEIPLNKKELLKSTTNGYMALAKIYPQLDYSPSSIKLSLYSLPLTYMGFGGYLNPFTNEAQIDGLIPLYKYPTTASHEIAHQVGYAAENETNFIGCLAAINNDNIYFKYSGYIFALKHCLNEIYRRDKDKYKSLVKLVNKGIIKNYLESQTFWESYQNPMEPIFKSTFNSFLKANNQDKGIESYSYVVALFVNYFKDNHSN